MKLYAISDLHLESKINRSALKEMDSYPNDGLILAGDIANTLHRMEKTLKRLRPRFNVIFWVPGNHELWTESHEDTALQGLEKYQRLVELCRDYEVITPEDPYFLWKADYGEFWIVPLFLLYDYSFRPKDIPFENAVDWAVESGIKCADEIFLMSEPFSSKSEWCHQRIEYSQKRLKSLKTTHPTILINHFPMREDLIRLHRIPRFSIWCGTQFTEDWHTQFQAKVVVTGHLHMRATDYRNGVRFEEVSLGNPRHWKQENGLDHYLREILPGEPATPEHGGPIWHF